MFKLLVLILFLYIPMCSAQNINGSYILNSGTHESGKILTFNKRSFIEKQTGHVGVLIGRGAFTLEKGRLLLNYIDVKNPDTSLYTIISTDISNASANLSIQVSEFDSGKAMQVMVGINDKSNHPMGSFFTDKNGEANVKLFKNKNLGYFIVDFIGFNRVSIPVEKLLGKNADILVKMKPMSIEYIEPKTISYKILEITDNGFVAVSEKNEKVIFSRIK